MDSLWNQRRSALALAVVLTAPAVVADESLGLNIEVSVTHDDNVSRGYGEGNVLRDELFSLHLNKGWRFPLTSNTRLLVQAFGGYNAYFEYSGLSHGYAGLQGDFQFRPSGRFGAPTFALTARSAIEEFESEARDSYRYMLGLSVRQPLTDRMQVAGALQYLVRDGESEVFDTQEGAVRFSMDYALFRRGALYLSLEYRMGDIVATGQPSLAFVELATAITPDDAFDDTTRFAYRMDGRVGLIQLGYNQSFGERHALDLSWRMANATPDSVAGASAAAQRIHYTVNQYTLAYLVRF
jgi:hypothetical protein